MESFFGIIKCNHFLHGGGSLRFNQKKWKHFLDIKKQKTVYFKKSDNMNEQFVLHFLKGL